MLAPCGFYKGDETKVSNMLCGKTNFWKDYPSTISLEAAKGVEYGVIPEGMFNKKFPQIDCGC